MHNPVCAMVGSLWLYPGHDQSDWVEIGQLVFLSEDCKFRVEPVSGEDPGIADLSSVYRMLTELFDGFREGAYAMTSEGELILMRPIEKCASGEDPNRPLSATELNALATTIAAKSSRQVMLNISRTFESDKRRPR